jgi:putative tricarboxylic transport membrane protein
LFKNKYLCILAVCSLINATAQAQSWAPTKNVEIVVGSAPGGSNDKTGRSVEKLLNELKLVPTSISVNNKPGGGGNILFAYVNQHPGDGHYLMVGTTALLSNHIVGSSKLNYTDFSPITSLFNDYVVFAVNANSPIKTGKDLVERLKGNPQSVSIGFATTLGSHNHIAAGLLMKAAGGNARELKAVAFKGSAEAVTALLGAHLELVTTAAGNVAAHVPTCRRGRNRASTSSTAAGAPSWARKDSPHRKWRTGKARCAKPRKAPNGKPNSNATIGRMIL